jgi:hypothetical protein
MKPHKGVVAVGFTVQAENGKAAEGQIRQLVQTKLSGDGASFEGVTFPIPPTARRWVLSYAPTRREYLALQHEHLKWMTRTYSLAKELRRLHPSPCEDTLWGKACEACSLLREVEPGGGE